MPQEQAPVKQKPEVIVVVWWWSVGLEEVDSLIYLVPQADCSRLMVQKQRNAAGQSMS